MKFFFYCPCGGVGGELREGEPGSIYPCPFCGERMMLDPKAENLMRPVTDEEKKADDEKWASLPDRFRAAWDKMTNRQN
jgi:hypothetical protein